MNSCRPSNNRQAITAIVLTAPLVAAAVGLLAYGLHEGGRPTAGSSHPAQSTLTTVRSSTTDAGSGKSNGNGPGYWAGASLASMSKGPLTNNPGVATPPGSMITPANEQTREVFDRDIKPIFNAHCVRCHGPEKQKRGLRLDTLELVLRGARDGEAVVVPGRPGDSLIYHRMTIPESADPAEEHMPPPHKKDSLSAAEITAVARWIEAWAP